MQGIHRGDRKADHRPAVVFTDKQIADQRDKQHARQGVTVRDVEVQRDARNHQTGKGSARPVQDPHPRRAIAVLRHEQHGH
ncbi:hypothetical protein D3C78_1491570 [compost metagenome]